MKKKIVDGIASKHNKIACYKEKYKKVLKNIFWTLSYKRRKIYFSIAICVYSLPNFNVRVILHGFIIDSPNEA